MKQTARWITLATFFLTVAAIGFMAPAHAADLPLAAASPLTGVAFDDRPLLLPVQRNFQMAMLTSGSELGRSCGKMEAYGWRMSQTEQARVNQIFNNTVDRLRLLGYTIAPQTLSSISKDITLFTADRNDKHFIFLWSAGELGLVLNLCETSAPVPSAFRPTPLAPSVQTFPVPMDVVPAHLDTAMSKTKSHNAGGFTPVGSWAGTYICAQGYTGGTLQIEHLRGRDFDGVFKFYPTVKNPEVASGSYSVYGQYDAESKRILVNPGKWIRRPADYYNTVMVGSFDAMRDSFSAYFQGITGCTSFEATRIGADSTFENAVRPAPKHARHVVKKKKPAKKPVVGKPATQSKEDKSAAPATAAPAAPAAAPLPGVSSAPVTPAAPAPTSSSAPAPAAPPPVPGSLLPAMPVAPAPAAPTQGTATMPAPAAAAAPADDKKDTSGGILLAAPAGK